MRVSALRIALVSGSLLLPVLACGSTKQSAFDDGATPSTEVDSGLGSDAGGGGFDFDGSLSDVFDIDAFYATDPPPMYCPVPGYVPDGGTPALPGGSVDCPDDKNRQGCPCDDVGKTAACWPGLRKNRNLGACHDGTTTCTHVNENLNAWGPCTGYTLPTPGKTTGKEACTCFSAGQWNIANTTVCYFNYGMTGPYGISTVLDSHGAAQCPPLNGAPPFPKPSTNWSTDTLKVDCAGHFKLCYELKAGSATNPMPSDCSLTKVCTEGDYPTANVVTPFPDLGSWSSSDIACANAFQTTGGYGEMTVIGKSVLCDEIDDGSGQPLVFNRLPYCRSECNSNPQAAGCAACSQSSGGQF